MSTVTRRYYRCERCGTRIPSDRAVLSKFTRKHYCYDVSACERRAKRAAA